MIVILLVGFLVFFARTCTNRSIHALSAKNKFAKIHYIFQTSKFHNTKNAILSFFFCIMIIPHSISSHRPIFESFPSLPSLPSLLSPPMLFPSDLHHKISTGLAQHSRIFIMLPSGAHHSICSLRLPSRKRPLPISGSGPF